MAKNRTHFPKQKSQKWFEQLPKKNPPAKLTTKVGDVYIVEHAEFTLKPGYATWTVNGPTYQNNTNTSMIIKRPSEYYLVLSDKIVKTSGWGWESEGRELFNLNDGHKEFNPLRGRRIGTSKLIKILLAID